MGCPFQRITFFILVINAGYLSDDDWDQQMYYKQPLTVTSLYFELLSTVMLCICHKNSPENRHNRYNILIGLNGKSTNSAK